MFRSKREYENYEKIESDSNKSEELQLSFPYLISDLTQNSQQYSDFDYFIQKNGDFFLKNRFSAS